MTWLERRKHNRKIRRMTADILPRPTGIAIALAAAVIFNILVFSIVFATAEEEPKYCVINVEPGSVLNFRAEPSTDGKILYQLEAGNIVKVHQTANKGEWSLVSWIKLEPLQNQNPAWVCSRFLTPADPEAVKEACADIASLMESCQRTTD